MTEVKKVKTHLSLAGMHFFLSEKKCIQLERFSGFDAYLKALSGGQIINQSEQRAAWHAAYRQADACDVVQDTFAKMCDISESIRNKQWDFDVQHVVNIGIGGSDLGPKLVCEAFVDEIDGPDVHFVSNLDLTEIQSVLKKLPPRNTLFIITSKSFRTLETIENMGIAKQWLLSEGCDPSKHMIAVTANPQVPEKAHKIPASQVLMMPEWVGGRYSIWSAVGLVCAIAFGFDRFHALHLGAGEMDAHFFSADLSNNVPAQYAFSLYQAINQRGVNALAVLPYAHRLRTLPDYLQQLFMESLGKHVDWRGDAIDYASGPIVYGSVGTNSQHSFQQLMMQGTHPVFADFILPLTQLGVDKLHQKKIISNCLTQVKTLRDGVPCGDFRRRIAGGQDANLFVLDALNLKTLGALLSFYEHVVETMAFLMNINPFDQFGVEHAKRASEALSAELSGVEVSVEVIASYL